MTEYTRVTALPAVMGSADEEKDPFLIALGERLRALRSRRGLTRKALARLANVSERHLANVRSQKSEVKRSSFCGS